MVELLISSSFTHYQSEYNTSSSSGFTFFLEYLLGPSLGLCAIFQVALFNISIFHNENYEFKEGGPSDFHFWRPLGGQRRANCCQELRADVLKNKKS